MERQEAAYRPTLWSLGSFSRRHGLGGSRREAEEVIPIPPVTVTATGTAPTTRAQALQKALQADGRESDGYRADLVSGAGLFDQTNIQNLPYAFAVAPSDLLENLQSRSQKKP